MGHKIISLLGQIMIILYDSGDSDNIQINSREIYLITLHNNVSIRDVNQYKYNTVQYP
ncbi:hypothetical protein RIR_e48642_A0A2N0NH10_9GLOM [Rhizophagus irregularis DAOM 181602=DAOM 197198]|nr:hypothetical protein RIR_e48642_A0A2N0NH10_9GLOM [Rhizophagus irregularis DAOM 181602=DAOM 197198]